MMAAPDLMEMKLIAAAKLAILENQIESHTSAGPDPKCFDYEKTQEELAR